jgi:hypothetical protein
MAGSLTNYAELEILDHITGNGSFTAPTPYLALYTAAPTDAGGGTEVSGGSYARVDVSGSFGAASGGSVTNDAEIAFPEATASWGTVVACAILDAASGGNMIVWADLATNRAVGSGVVARFPIGTLTITLD